MQLVNCHAGDVLQGGRVYRATWGRSLLGDLADGITFGFHSENQLQLWSADVGARIPDLGVGWRSAGPTVNAAADAFTIDISTLKNLPATSTVGRFADQLNGIGGSNLTLTRLELVGSGESTAAAEQGRQQATADAIDQAGVTAIPGELADAAKSSLFSIVLGVGYVILVGAVIYSFLSPKQREEFMKAWRNVY